MLIQIGTGGPRGTAQELDAIERLVDCHGRIRHFTALACQLARSAARPEGQVQEAAQQLVRYFSTAFPLHVIDEEQSLLPRLRALARAPDVDAALSALEFEHADIDPLVAELLPIWSSLIDAPATLKSFGRELSATSEALEAALASHLELEEEVIFSWARTVLSPEALSQIRDEMKARR